MGEPIILQKINHLIEELRRASPTKANIIYAMDWLVDIKNLYVGEKTEDVSIPNGWGIKIDKDAVIKLLKRKKKHNEYGFPFEIMSYEYGNGDREPTDEEEEQCRNGLETDDIETLEEDDEGYYENFELRMK